MTSELEDKLRAALHERGAAITADRLRPPDRARKATPHDPVWAISALVKPDRRPRSMGARLAPILAAAAVVAIIVTLALVVSGGSGPSQPAGGQSSALAGVLGRGWVLKTVQSPDGNTTTISASTSASVTFLSTGDRIEFQDGVGAFQAAYTRTANGDLQVHDVSGGPGNYRGHDRSQLAAIAGIDAIGVPYSNSAPPPMQVQLVSGRLHITTQGYQLTLDDPVRVAPSASRLPSSPPAETTTTAAQGSPTGS